MENLAKKHGINTEFQLRNVQIRTQIEGNTHNMGSSKLDGHLDLDKYNSSIGAFEKIPFQKILFNTKHDFAHNQPLHLKGKINTVDTNKKFIELLIPEVVCIKFYSHYNKLETLKRGESIIVYGILCTKQGIDYNGNSTFQFTINEFSKIIKILLKK